MISLNDLNQIKKDFVGWTILDRDIHSYVKFDITNIWEYVNNHMDISKPIIEEGFLIKPPFDNMLLTFYNRLLFVSATGNIITIEEYAWDGGVVNEFIHISDTHVAMDDHGAFMRFKSRLGKSMIDKYLSEQRKPEIENQTKLIISTLLYSFVFMNCRNVEIVTKKDRYKINNPKKSNKKDKTSNFKSIEYKVLEISRSSKRYMSDDGNSWKSSHKRLHICRGHFSRYTKERPLFGKYVGMVWIPAHVRGDANLGEVHKDYSFAK